MKVFLLRFSAIDNLSRRSGTESRTRSQWLNNPYSNEFNRKATEGKRKEKKKKKKHQNNRRTTHTSLVRLPCNIRQNEQSIEIYQNKGVFSLSLFYIVWPSFLLLRVSLSIMFSSRVPLPLSSYWKEVISFWIFSNSLFLSFRMFVIYELSIFILYLFFLIMVAKTTETSK